MRFNAYYHGIFMAIENWMIPLASYENIDFFHVVNITW